MNIYRCIYFRDFSVDRCALNIMLAKVRDEKGRVPCLASSQYAMPSHLAKKRCKARDLPSEQRVDEHFARVAAQARLIVLQSGEPLLGFDDEPPLGFDEEGEPPL